MDAQFVTVVAEAAKLYSESAGASVEDFMNPPMRTLDDLKKQVDRQNDGFTAFRAKRESLFGALSAMLKPIEVVGEIAVGPASEVFPPSQNIFAAVMYLINAANNVSDAYDTILELFVQTKVGCSPPHAAYALVGERVTTSCRCWAEQCWMSLCSGYLGYTLV